MFPSPDQNLKIGSGFGRESGFFFFFFFFFFTYQWESWVFQKKKKIKFLNEGKLGRNAVKKRIYKSCKCFFLSHWIQILANSSPKSDIKKKIYKKKPEPWFFSTFYRSVGRGHNITFFFFFFWPYSTTWDFLFPSGKKSLSSTVFRNPYDR